MSVKVPILISTLNSVPGKWHYVTRISRVARNCGYPFNIIELASYN